MYHAISVKNSKTQENNRPFGTGKMKIDLMKILLYTDYTFLTDHVICNRPVTVFSCKLKKL